MLIIWSAGDMQSRAIRQALFKVKAHAEAWFCSTMRRDLVPHPALKQHKLARVRGDLNVHLFRPRRLRRTRWRVHEKSHARILDLEGARAGRTGHIVNATDTATRVGMHGVMCAKLHAVDPTGRHLEFPELFWPVQPPHHFVHMGFQPLGQIGKVWAGLVQLIHRGIAGVSAKVVRSAPASTKAINGLDLPNLSRQSLVPSSGCRQATGAKKARENRFQRTHGKEP
jgi:hypothetical protein